MKSIFTKAAAAAVLLAGVSTAAMAVPVVEMRISDIIVDGLGNPVSLFAQKSCISTAVAACNAAGFSFVVTGGGLRQITFGTSIAGIGGVIDALSGEIGTFLITTTSGSSNVPGTATEAFLNRSQTEATRLAPVDGLIHRLVVDFRSFGYEDPDGEFKTLSGSASMSANLDKSSLTDSVTTRFSVDKNNGVAETAFIECTMTATTNPLSESCSLPVVPWTDTFAPASMFSMRSQQQFDVAVGTSINSTANSSVRNVPEPMTTTLVGIALAGLALAGRRGAKKA